VRILDDKVEKHRDMSLSFIEIYLQFAQNKGIYNLEIIGPLIRVLIQRLNQHPFNEVSEELRFRLLKIF
jgi:hypothetical protein